jgi:hypothetical protein
MYDWLSYEMLSYLSSFGANEGKAYGSEEVVVIIQALLVMILLKRAHVRQQRIKWGQPIVVLVECAL